LVWRADVAPTEIVEMGAQEDQGGHSGHERDGRQRRPRRDTDRPGAKAAEQHRQDRMDRKQLGGRHWVRFQVAERIEDPGSQQVRNDRVRDPSL